jgi:hypothetical protein
MHTLGHPLHDGEGQAVFARPPYHLFLLASID